MTGKPHRWLGWIVCALGLVLASQVVQAASPCVSMTDAESGASFAAMQSLCMVPAGTSDDCVVNAPRIDAGPTAPLPSPVPSLAVVLDQRPAIVHVGTERMFFAGLAPGSRLPFHILFHRYLI